MLDRATREYLLKQSPSSLMEIIEGKDLRLRAAERRMKMARRRLRTHPIHSDHSALILSDTADILDWRKRKDLDQ